MPKVKKVSTTVHPNSRKAMQLARQGHRDTKMDRRKEEANMKLVAKLRKLKWFKSNVDKSKSVYTNDEVHELIEKYFQRFNEEEAKLEEKRSMKFRHCNERMGHEYKTKFAVERERQEYESTGIEVPQLTKESSFKYFTNWDGDAKFLTAIDMVTVSKSTKCK